MIVGLTPGQKLSISISDSLNLNNQYFKFQYNKKFSKMSLDDFDIVRRLGKYSISIAFIFSLEITIKKLKTNKIK